MENKKQLKISLGTVICICIIIALICALIGLWCYYNRNNSTLEIVNIENEEDKYETTKIDYNKEFVKNISLNGGSHEIAFVYSNKKQDEEIELNLEDIEILFDNKVIKTFYEIGSFEKRIEPEIVTIIGEANREYEIIKIQSEGNGGITTYFTFINEKGEILGIIEHCGGTGIVYKGENLTYEINKDNMKLYKALSFEDSDFIVVEYNIRVWKNKIHISTNRKYTSDEVILAGSKE